MLMKSIKRKEQKKKQSKKKWEERVQAEEKRKEATQKKRKTNIKERAQKKKEKKLDKLAKKGKFILKWKLPMTTPILSTWFIDPVRIWWSQCPRRVVPPCFESLMIPLDNKKLKDIKNTPECLAIVRPFK